MEANYKSVNDSRQGLTPNHPYGAGDPYYAESTGYITPQPAKKRGISNWIKIGVPVLILIIVAAVLGGVLGSRASKNDSASSNGASGADSNSPDGSGNNNVDLADSRFATATDSQWLEPLYPSTVRNFSHYLPPSNLTLHPFRPILQSSPPRLSAQPAMTFSPGRRILSLFLILPQLPYAQTVRASLLQLTSGKLFPHLSPTIPISGVGMTPYSPMPLAITMNLPSNISWMVPVAFSTMLATSNGGSRLSAMLTA